MAILRRKPILLIVESAPWRLHPGVKNSLAKRAWAWWSERCSRWCVNHATLVIVTQAEYRTSLRTRNPEGVHLIQASWVHDEDLLSGEQAAAAWRSKTTTSSLRLLFAGRLVRSKGVALLLETVSQLAREDAPIEIDILGEGEMLAECEGMVRRMVGRTRVRTIGTMPYDASFFRLLRSYHAVLAPSLSDEQPRIAYDAFSQAVPVLANKTAGLLQCVEEGRTGKFAVAADVVSWVDLIRWSSQNIGVLEGMGLTALEFARGKTLRRMHEQRWQLLRTMLNGRTGV